MSTGEVTDVATPIWLRAAMMPRPRMKIDARLASSRPYASSPSAVLMRSLAAVAMAAATTTMTIATTALGSQATIPSIRSDTGLGPHTPNAI